VRSTAERKSSSSTCASFLREIRITKKVDGSEGVINGDTGFQVRSRSRRAFIAEERRRPQDISGVDLMINEMGYTTAME
jgi:hypothetical protein